jgi:predicted Zn-dependent protease
MLSSGGQMRISIRLSPTKFWTVVLCALTCIPSLLAGAQSTPAQRAHDNDGDEQVVSELQIGISLTSQSKFQDAIPHLLAAKLQGDRSFAGQFDLALCYVATAQYRTAIEILKGLEDQNPRNANVYSLLAQAYVLTNRIPDAIDALKKSAALAPKNEKLYLLLGDACMERGQYSIGLDVASLGLKNLPDSVGLLYQRGMFLTLLDQFDTGKVDLERAAKIGRGSEIAFLAAAQRASFEGNMAEVVRVSREGSKKYRNAALLTMLGEALIRTGVMPGQPEFAEAVAALEKSVAMLPENPTSRIALGKLYLMESRSQDAIVHLEAARQLDPDNTAVYSNLAKAYRQIGNQDKAQKMLLYLSELNQEQAENIRSAPGERKSSYLGSRLDQPQYSSSKPVSKEPSKQP